VPGIKVGFPATLALVKNTLKLPIILFPPIVRFVLLFGGPELATPAIYKYYRCGLEPILGK